MEVIIHYAHPLISKSRIWWIKIWILSSNTDINNTGQYTNANNTLDWKDPENNLRIHFTYLPEYPLAGNITKLVFHVQNLQTGNYLKNLVAGITITNNMTIAKIDGIKDTNGAFSRFTNILVANGIFSLNYRFLEEGTHQVIVNMRSGNFSLALASFSSSTHNLKIIQSHLIHPIFQRMYIRKNCLRRTDQTRKFLIYI